MPHLSSKGIWGTSSPRHRAASLTASWATLQHVSLCAQLRTLLTYLVTALLLQEPMQTEPINASGYTQVHLVNALLLQDSMQTEPINASGHKHVPPACMLSSSPSPRIQHVGVADAQDAAAIPQMCEAQPAVGTQAFRQAEACHDWPARCTAPHMYTGQQTCWLTYFNSGSSPARRAAGHRVALWLSAEL